jgi:hypothetical protein
MWLSSTNLIVILALSICYGSYNNQPEKIPPNVVVDRIID